MGLGDEGAVADAVGGRGLAWAGGRMDGRVVYLLTSAEVATAHTDAAKRWEAEADVVAKKAAVREAAGATDVDEDERLDRSMVRRAVDLREREKDLRQRAAWHRFLAAHVEPGQTFRVDKDEALNLLAGRL